MRKKIFYTSVALLAVVALNLVTIVRIKIRNDTDVDARAVSCVRGFCSRRIVVGARSTVSSRYFALTSRESGVTVRIYQSGHVDVVTCGYHSGWLFGQSVRIEAIAGATRVACE